MWCSKRWTSVGSRARSQRVCGKQGGDWNSFTLSDGCSAIVCMVTSKTEEACPLKDYDVVRISNFKVVNVKKRT